MYPLIGHIDNGMVAGAIREIFVLSSQFCCKPKIALKTRQQQQQQKKHLFKKNKKWKIATTIEIETIDLSISVPRQFVCHSQV